MEKLKKKRQTLNKALIALGKAISYYENLLKLPGTDLDSQIFEDRESALQTLRDSMIQRFEFCVDLLWKYVKTYLQEHEKMDEADIASPRGVFRIFCNTRFINENESDTIMEMLSCRNQTSHIYKEEIAEFISKMIPKFYVIMKNIVDRLPAK